jgi:BolA protein
VNTRIERIEAALRNALSPLLLQVEDESHLHAGHAGAASGHGHYRVTLVSAAFVGMPLLARHRAVYAALGELMQTDIHAVSIQARSPQEVGAQSG